MSRTQGHFLAGIYVHGTQSQKVLSPQGDLAHWSISTLNNSYSEDLALCETALEAASICFEQMQKGFFGSQEREQFFNRVASNLEAHSENLAQLLAQEIGKPLTLARAEVERAKTTWAESLRVCLKESKIFEQTQSQNRRLNFRKAQTQNRLRGPLLAITPFNFPLNLALHKIGPALALGIPVIWKPSPKAFLSSMALCDLIQSSGLPAGFLSVLNCDNDLTLKMAMDVRIKQVSFTGSATVGWNLQAAARKPVLLELGGAAPVWISNSAVHTSEDCRKVARSIVTSAFGFAGQSCISAQSAGMTAETFAKLHGFLAEETEKFVSGHPRNPEVLCGPVIDVPTSHRIQAIIKEALAKEKLVRIAESQLFQASAPELPENAELRSRHIGGPKPPMTTEAFIAPSLYSLSKNCPTTETFLIHEIFAPVLFVSDRWESLDAWIDWANTLPSRLHASVFTRDSSEIELALTKLDFGGIVFNEGPSQRDDTLAYGGEGLAGLGREGPLWTAKDFLSFPQSVLEFAL